MTRLARFAPLTGVVFAILALAGFASAKTPPGASANGTDVVTFYEAHASGQKTADILLAIAFAFFLCFAGSLRGHLRRTPAAENLAALTLAGAAVLTAGAATYFGLDYALASAPGHLAPAAAQALNVLALKLSLPVSAGALVFGLAVGLAILRSGQLPSWLGWAAIVIGIAAASPATIVALVALYLWSLVVGVVMCLRSSTDSPRSG